jgi:hypothetical protein
MAPVTWILAALLFASGSAALAADAHVPLYDSVSLNIGINCRWERSCIAVQQRAMRRALDYVRSKQPAASRIHLCNRNASRGRYRVDWVGFDNCIRNRSLSRR